jgi:cobalamin biosynthesis protein CobD/CbiB
MLGFTSVETLAAWRADARPVPADASLVALSAMEAGAAALLVDLAGPTTYVVEGDLLEGLARRWVLADTGQGLAFVEEVDEDEVSE